MAKIKAYPKAYKFDDEDVILKDGPNGTMQIAVEDVIREFGRELSDETLSEAGKLAPADKVGVMSKDIEAISHVSSQASGIAVEFPDGAAGLPLTALSIGIGPTQSGVGDPSPENIRKISGWTGARIRRTGPNLWSGLDLARDFVAADPSGVIDETAKTVTFTKGRGYDGEIVTLFKYAFKPKTAYVFNMNAKRVGTSGTNTNLCVVYTDGSIFEWSISDRGSGTYTTDGSKTIDQIALRSVDGQPTIEVKYEESFFWEGTDYRSYYKKYTSREISVDWHDAAGTVYVGSLDALTGSLSSKADLFTFTGEETWTISGDITTTGVFRTIISIERPQSDYEVHPLRNPPLCSHFQWIGSTIEPGFAVRILNTGIEVTVRSYSYGFTTLDEWTTWLANQYNAGSPVQILVGLRNADTYTIQPIAADVLEILDGFNSLFSNTGSVDVTYTANYQLKTDAAILERTRQEVICGYDEKFPTSSGHSYNTGEFLMMDGQLYRVTAPIQAGLGGKIVPGENVKLTTITEQLIAIYNLINS